MKSFVLGLCVSFVSKASVLEPRWALVFMVSGDRFRMDALSGREAEWFPAFHCQFSPWHRLTGFAPQFSKDSRYSLKDSGSMAAETQH